MLGPLPYLHRLLLVVVAVLVSTGIGAWFGLMPDISMGVSLGVVLGLTAGVCAAFVLVHDFHHHHEVRTAPVRRHLR